MDVKTDTIQEFFSQLWRFTADKHNQGVYNIVCLVVLLALPLLVFITIVMVCCHCCCRHANSHCCCGNSMATARSEEKKKTSANNEDLWISVKTEPTTPDLVAMTPV